MNDPILSENEPIENSPYYENGHPTGSSPSTAENKQPDKTPVSGISIASLVMGILGLLSCGMCFMPFSICAIVFGFLSKGENKKKPVTAIIGIITGFVGIAIGIIMYILISCGILISMNWS